VTGHVFGPARGDFAPLAGVLSLPSIRTGLHAAQSELQWVVSGYALAFGLVLVPAGRIGDLHGRRTTFVVALGLFTASSAAEGWRAVFFVNIPIGLIAMPIAWRLLPLVQEREWSGDGKWLLIPAAGVLALAFVFWERRYARHGKEPVVDFELLNRPALLAGLAITPFAVGSGLTAGIGGRVVHRFGRPMVAGGLVLVGLGFAGCSSPSTLPRHSTPVGPRSPRCWWPASAAAW
jgi:MFS family permease